MKVGKYTINLCKAALATLLFSTGVLRAQTQQPKKPWVYTQDFHDGQFTFVSSNKKVYTANCLRVEYESKARSGPNVCLNTLGSVNGCTPALGYPKTDTISFDGKSGNMLYRGTLSTEVMRLKAVRAATDEEFSRASAVCSKVPWER